MATKQEEAGVQDSRVEHLRGCPAKRIEAYTQPAPDGLMAHVVRCQDCGVSVVTKKEARRGQE